MNVIYKYKEYIALDNGQQRIIKNSKGKEEHHAHFDTKNIDTIKTCIKLCDQKKVPRSNYILTACMRLTLDQEYKENLKRIRERRNRKYVNVNKGVKV